MAAAPPAFAQASGSSYYGARGDSAQAHYQAAPMHGRHGTQKGQLFGGSDQGAEEGGIEDYTAMSDDDDDDDDDRPIEYNGTDGRREDLDERQCSFTSSSLTEID